MDPSLESFPEATVLGAAWQAASEYLAGLAARPVYPGPEALAGLERLAGPLPEEGAEPEAVVEELRVTAAPATVASAGARYFGFVTGGSLPAALGAAWLADAWDQNAAHRAMSPAAAALEEVAAAWVLEALGLPAGAGVGLVTGATTANVAGLAAARHELLMRQGWDAGSNGLFGAPPLRVVVGEEVHVSLLKALSLLGLGSERVLRVPADHQGRMREDALPQLDGRTILCLQAGNVNTGASDPFEALCRRAREAGAWVHVDGAFGLWLAASPVTAPQVAGVERADSWATDAHKWLNVPYDCGLAICRDPGVLRRAMAAGSASYLQPLEGREPEQYVLEMSRHARGVELWAALRSLGRKGVAALVERCCSLARRFAEGLAAAGHEVLNEIVANQVLVSFGDRTAEVIAAVQSEGTCWCGGTVWQGRPAMRISVSSWRTTEADVDNSLEAILRAAAG